jgi:hypothetical protein
MTQVEQDVEKKAVEMKSQAPEVPFAEPPPGPICTPGITAMLNKEEQDFVNSDENRRLYAAAPSMTRSNCSRLWSLLLGLGVSNSA